MIYLRENTRVLVQGITGRQGSLHTKLMLEYGTKIVAGVTPGKGGSDVLGVPVFDSVREAVSNVGEIDASIIFVPAAYAADAVYEEIDAGIPLIVVITEHIPVHDTAKFVNYARMKGSVIIGPNTPGIIAPSRRIKIGIMPSDSFSSGSIGIVSRSGTLTYEISEAISKEGFGTSTTLGIGGDPITGLNFVDVLAEFEKDDETEAVVLVGEIGGNAEEEAAEYIKKGYKKPVVAYIAGRMAPPGKRMGHAGAIITGGQGTAESKERALRSANVPVARKPDEVADLLKAVLRR